MSRSAIDTQQHTSVLTEALGGGSHTAVMPASFISWALLASTVYHAGSLRCEHSQLKPCIIQADSLSVLKARSMCNHSTSLQAAQGQESQTSEVFL